MNEIYNSIKTTKLNLLFHRRMTLTYFFVLIIIFIAFITLEILTKKYETDAIIKVATALQNAPTNISLKINSPEKLNNFFPESIDIDNLSEISNSKISITLPILVITVFLIFAIYGFLRHHLKRISIAEDRLYFLEKIAPLLENEKYNNKEIIEAWIGYERDSTQKSSNTPSFHPGQEILENSIDMLSSIKDKVSKR